MKCPKCKENMIEVQEGSAFARQVFLYCENKECEFYGIKRLNIEEIKE